MASFVELRLYKTHVKRRRLLAKTLDYVKRIYNNFNVHTEVIRIHYQTLNFRVLYLKHYIVKVNTLSADLVRVKLR